MLVSVKFIGHLSEISSSESLVEVSRLNTQETWELECDEQLGSHTKLPNLFHDMVVTKGNMIYENVLSVNVTKGERKVCSMTVDFH